MSPRPVVGAGAGTWPAGVVELSSNELSVALAPELGGRVVSVVHRSSGREWLVQGTPPRGSEGRLAWSAEEAVFTGDRAFGWDECLPTIAPCPDPLDPGGGPLRDHGDGWGRPVSVDLIGGPADGLVPRARFGWTVAGRYSFESTLSVDGAVIRADYRMTSLGPAVPFLWSMHPLLALEPGSRLEIGAGVSSVAVTNHVGLDLVLDGSRAAWPRAARRADPPIDLSVIPDVDAGHAIKAYVDRPAGTAGAHQPDGSSLVLDWDRGVAPVLGIWLDAGGWPPGEARHQVALEPTTAPFDDLAGAMEAGRAAWVRPGHDVRWWATMTLAGPPAGETRG